MIQEAHIGVGMFGSEGMQAVRASDFAIAQVWRVNLAGEWCEGWIWSTVSVKGESGQRWVWRVNLVNGGCEGWIWSTVGVNGESG